jgi:RNA polymerase sigma-70 factor (ECF subfamily)
MPSEARDSEGSTVRRGLVVAGVGRVDEDALDAVEPLDMDEDAFRAFYDLTSGAVWAYLSHITGDTHAADDLLQETYIRFLGVRRRWDSDAHRRNYLFRIATNLAHDLHRRSRLRRTEPFDETQVQAGAASPAAGSGAAVARAFPGLSQVEGRPAIYEERADLHRALDRLSPRERQMLWLAYAEGSTHQEIADTLGLRAGGIRVLLFRARRKLAALMTLRLAQKNVDGGRTP